MSNNGSITKVKSFEEEELAPVHNLKYKNWLDNYKFYNGILPEKIPTGYKKVILSHNKINLEKFTVTPLTTSSVSSVSKPQYSIIDSGFCEDTDGFTHIKTSDECKAAGAGNFDFPANETPEFGINNENYYPKGCYSQPIPGTIKRSKDYYFGPNGKVAANKGQVKLCKKTPEPTTPEPTTPEPTTPEPTTPESTSKEEDSKEEASTEEASTEEDSTEEAYTEEDSTEEASTEEASTEEDLSLKFKTEIKNMIKLPMWDVVGIASLVFAIGTFLILNKK